jgi:predicted AAA+ superfamily ATPase
LHNLGLIIPLTKKVSQELPEYKRFLFDKINFNSKLIGLIGSRGAGKTTLVLQYPKSLTQTKKLKSDE